MMMEFLATDERISPTRRQANSSVTSSTTRYQAQSSGSGQPAAAAYRVFAHSQPSAASYQEGPATFVTQVTEETQVIQIPAQQQQQYNEITYTIQDKQPKFEPVSFQVSTRKDNIKPVIAQPPPSSSSSTIQDSSDPNPFKIFGAKLRSRPTQGIVPSYEDQTMTSYSQQTSSSAHSQYQQSSSSSLPPIQPNFSKIRQ